MRLGIQWGQTRKTSLLFRSRVFAVLRPLIGHPVMLTGTAMSRIQDAADESGGPREVGTPRGPLTRSAGDALVKDEEALGTLSASAGPIEQAPAPTV